MKDSSNQSIFHCHYQGCLYVKGSERYFTAKRLLNQHIAKVHAEKKYLCTKCQKGYSNDWFRKNHEKSCESKWRCSCGLQYQHRESLLTHFRRSNHALPEGVLPKKKSPLKQEKKDNSAVKPLVIILQPVVTYVPFKQTTAVDSSIGGTRFILPKHLQQPQPQPLLINLNTAPPVSTISSEINQMPDASNNNLMASFSSNAPAESLSQNCGIKHQTKSVPRKNNFNKTAAETQTCDFLKHCNTFQAKRSLKHSESRGSQCTSASRNNVNIESTCTQTMESAVVKMKRKYSRSRRKSVAVTTDTEEFQQNSLPWSDLENYLFKDTISENKLDKYSSATQTSPGLHVSNKIFRDSQTLTDDFFQFTWSTDKANELIDDSSFQALSDFTVAHTLAESQVNSTSDQNLFSLKHSTQSSNATGTQDALEWLSKESGICPSNLNNSGSLPLPGDNSNSETNAEIISSLLDSYFPEATTSATPSDKNINLDEQIFVENFSNTADAQSENLDPVLDFTSGNNSQVSALSHNHTQTVVDTIDYSSILANMETQTTDDFLFPDLEFLDNETQTPWNDIPNDILPVDYLSIEIQTDNSSLATDHASNFSLASDTPINDYNTEFDKVVVGRHMETQTQDIFPLPELANSEAQTLFDADHLFN